MRLLHILFFFLINTGCFAQSLKDSLFSGKLKVDSALLIKSKVNLSKPVMDSVKKTEPDTLNKMVTDSLSKQNNTQKPVISYQDNNKIWKKFIDQYTSVINAEVLPDKKIKRGTYSVMIEYEIGTDGEVTTKNVTSTPPNNYLVEQVKERMMPDAPLLAPLIRDGLPRKSARRQVIVFVKEKN